MAKGQASSGEGTDERENLIVRSMKKTGRRSHLLAFYLMIGLWMPLKLGRISPTYILHPYMLSYP